MDFSDSCVETKVCMYVRKCVHTYAFTYMLTYRYTDIQTYRHTNIKVILHDNELIRVLEPRCTGHSWSYQAQNATR